MKLLFLRNLWFTLLYKLNKLDSTDRIVYLLQKKDLSKEIANGEVGFVKIKK